MLCRGRQGSSSPSTNRVLAGLAHPVEQGFYTAQVVGSIPAPRTKFSRVSLRGRRRFDRAYKASSSLAPGTIHIADVSQRQRKHVERVSSASSNLAVRTTLE